MLGKRGLLGSPCPGFAVCGESDAWWGEGDAAVAVESAGGLFEGFFADAEAFADEFGRGLVVEVEFAAGSVEGLDDAVCEGADPAVAGGIEGEVEFAVWADGFDEALELLAWGEGDTDFCVVEEPAGEVVDGGFVAEGSFGGDDEVDGVTG